MYKNNYFFSKELKKLKIWTELDIQFSNFLVKNNNPMVFFAYAYLSSYIREGNICLSLSHLSNPLKLFKNKYPFLVKKILNSFNNPNKKTWKNILLKERSVSNGKYIKPIILDNNKLYMYKMWKYEIKIYKFFINSYKNSCKYEKNKLIKILNYLFPKKTYKEINWQKISIFILLTRKLSILSGGPGTGKTSIISKFIISLLFLKKNNINKIVISAPTGKAASNLFYIVNNSITKIKKYSFLIKNISLKYTTLHRLLGAKKSGKMFYNKYNKLNLDVLIIDESSMIDLYILYNIVISFPKNAFIVFIGDHNQISSTDSGYIFNSICKSFNIGYSTNRIKEILKFTGINIFKKINEFLNEGIYDNFSTLKKNYRFRKNSNINKISNYINLGNSKKIINFFIKKKKNIKFINLINKKNYFFMLKNCIKFYKKYLIKIINNYSPELIINSFNKYRLLCVLREGPFGVNGLNKIIEYNLIQNNLINIKLFNNKKIYIGKPIIIKKNSESLKLYNGDIGILLFDKKKHIFAFFKKNNNEIYKVPLNKLPKYETSFAITVYKSQGSEFSNTALVLPNIKLPILTREILYTSITRTSKKFFLYSNVNVLKYTIKNKINYENGLIERINNFIKK